MNHVIIWNEPNLSFEWGYRPVDPEGYVELLRAVYPRARAANPDVVVLAGALAPTLEPEGSTAGLSDLAYLERMYRAGAAGYFDALAAHAYGLTFPPDEPPAPGAINFRRVELLREVMVAHGDGRQADLCDRGGLERPPALGQFRPPGRAHRVHHRRLRVGQPALALVRVRRYVGLPLPRLDPQLPGLLCLCDDGL